MLRLNSVVQHLSPSVSVIPRVTFSSLPSLDELKKPNYEQFFNETTRRRKPSPIRQLQPLTRMPGMISLGEGRPNPALFPFKGLTLTAPNGDQIPFSETELKDALNYSQTLGLPLLTNQLRQITEKEHKPPLPEKDWTLMVTNGSQDGICKAMEALVSEGDYVILERPSYAGALEILRGLGANFIEVPTDSNGMIPELLDEALRDHKGRRPKILYTTPTGQNPGGTTLTTERKKKIIQLASKYDFLILEDDPYYYLHYGTDPAPPEGKDELFRRPPIRSLFSLDPAGRVLRFESFSKVLSSGLRLGVAIGPNPLIERIERHQEVGPMHTSGVTQTMAAKLLQYWGEKKWEEHTKAVALFYARRRDWFSTLCKKHLTGLAEWNIPSAGMFLWLKLSNITDSKALINEKARTAKVLLVPGEVFSCFGHKTPYVRASFSGVTKEDADIALGRLAALLKEEQRR